MDASNVDVASRLLDSGVPATEVTKNLGIGRATLYRSLRYAPPA